MLIYRKIKYRFLIIWFSLKWIPAVNLGDDIIYKGDVYTIYNGISPLSWNVQKKSDKSICLVPKNECRKVRSLKNYLHGFFSGYHFYNTSWYDIWVNEGIKDWMRECQIFK